MSPYHIALITAAVAVLVFAVSYRILNRLLDP